MFHQGIEYGKLCRCLAYILVMKNIKILENCLIDNHLHTCMLVLELTTCRLRPYLNLQDGEVTWWTGSKTLDSDHHHYL